MYVLVYAPHGIVGERGSWAEAFDSHEEAHERMRVCAYSHPERDSLSEVDIDEWHATTYVSDPDGPEWHIYEV